MPYETLFPHRIDTAAKATFRGTRPDGISAFIIFVSDALACEKRSNEN